MLTLRQRRILRLEFNTIFSEAHSKAFLGCAFCVYDKNSTIFDIQFDNMSAAHLCKYTILIGMIDNCKFELYNKNDEMFIKYDESTFERFKKDGIVCRRNFL